MPRLSEHEKRDRKIAREIAASARLAGKAPALPDGAPARRRNIACGCCGSMFKPRNRVHKFCSAKCQKREGSKRHRETQPEKVREHSARFHAKHPEKRREYGARFRAKQPKKKPLPRLTRNISAAKRALRAREKHRRQQLRWARANPDCTAEAHRKWKAKQEPELFRQYDRDRYAADPEKKKARSRAHYAANRDSINAKRRERRASRSMLA